MNCFYPGKFSSNQLRKSACRTNSWFASREILKPDSDKNLADQAAVAENCAGHHCVARAFTDCPHRFAQAQFRQQCSSIVKKARHGFQTWRDDSTHVIAAGGYDIESYSG